MAFVEGRKIGDNILIYQELMHNYHKENNMNKRCAIKVDLFKAYDMVRWNFILKVLKVMRIHPTFVK